MANRNTANANGTQIDVANRQYSIEEMKHLFKSGEGADVEFLVGVDDDVDCMDEEKKRTIKYVKSRSKRKTSSRNNSMREKRQQLFKAHRSVLSNGSPVFATQFNFPVQQEGPIQIMDLTADSFKIMLAYLYLKNLDGINPDNVMDVYSAAKKYMINALMESCLDSLYNNKNLTQENVFLVLENAKFHDEKELFDNCLYFIKKKPKVLNSTAFFQLSLEQITDLFFQLNIREVLLFKALCNWATENIKNDSLGLGNKKRPKKQQNKTMRDVLGDAIYVIQFQLMSRQEFINEIVSTGGLLEDKQIIAFLVHYFEESNAEVKRLYPVELPSKMQKEICLKLDKKLCFGCACDHPPQHFNSADCSKRLKLAEDGLTFHSNSGDYRWGTIRAAYSAFSFHLHSCADRLTGTYYEVELVEFSSVGMFLMGFCDVKFPLDGYSAVGHSENSFGLHSTGSYYFEGESFDIENRSEFCLDKLKMHKRDVLGVGIVKFRSTHHLEFFFTKNGCFKGRRIVNVENVASLHPAISIHSYGGTKLETNFGQKPFRYELAKLAREE